jgi:hypothetical protein
MQYFIPMVSGNKKVVTANWFPRALKVLPDISHHEFPRAAHHVEIVLEVT